MLELNNIDLRTDASAATFVKTEVVQVRFAPAAGALMSREGPNTYQAGDALVTGATGDLWSVTRSRFEGKYEAVSPGQMGSDGAYRARPVPVLARQMSVPFSIARSAGSDVLHGKADDWLTQYAPGDYGVVERERFAQVYRPWIA